VQAIVICTVNNPGVTVLLESIRIYAPTMPVYLSGNSLELWHRAKSILPNLVWRPNQADNFGDAYNVAADYAFEHGKYNSVILSNDDVVLNPDTIKKLTHDTQILESKAVNFGILGARSDYVLHDQNIRFPVYDDRQEGLRWASEGNIKETDVIAPIFASISRKAWDTAKFPSTNWYSDNIICHDLQEAGFRHFVSRAYVHHAGSQTVGDDFKKCHEEPRAWIKANRPDMYEAIYG
jgi:GT2 family glycosyltransferase